MKIAKSLILSTLALGMTVGAYATFAAPEQESKVIAVSTSTGTLESGATATWTSNDENPKLSVNFPFFMMSPYNDQWNMSYGAGKAITFTTDEGWYVSEISLNPYGDTSGSIKIGETTFTPTMGSDVVSVTFTQDETPTIEAVSVGSGLYLKNFNVTVSKVQEEEVVDPQPVVTIPAEGKYYRLLTRFNGDQSQARYGTCIELLRDAADKGNNAQADRLWSNAPAEEGADNYDYQWFTFEADPAGSGYYALVCKAKPNGSVNSVPSVSTNSNTARFDYDNEAKHYGFYLVSEVNGKTTQGTDEAGFYSSITSKDAGAGWYMNVSAAGQGFSVHLYSDPTDQNAGLFTFEPMPETEVVEPEVVSIKVVAEDGAFSCPEGNNSDGYAYCWTSTSEDPQLAITATRVATGAGINNFTKKTSGDLDYYVGNTANAPTQLTLTASEGWYISAYTFKAKPLSATSTGAVITIDGVEYIPSTEGTLVDVTCTEGTDPVMTFSGSHVSTLFSDFVVTIAKVKEEEGGEEPEPEYTQVWLDRSNWTADASSQTEDSDDVTVNAPNKAFDDNVNTFWGASWYHVPFSSVDYQVFHIDLGQTEDLDGLSYMNRQSGNWDVIGDYEIYVTDEAVPVSTPDASKPYDLYDFSGLTADVSGTMERKSGEQIVDFDQTLTGRHFYLKVTSAYMSAANTSTCFSIAEIKFYAMKVKEEGGEEPEPVDEPVVVYNANGTWSINTFCCEETTGETAAGPTCGLISSLIDNDPATYYHSDYTGNKYDGHHGFILDLGKTTNVAGLAWLSRRHENAPNGPWRHYSAWFFNSADELPELADHAAYEAYLASNTPDAEADLYAGSNAPVETSMFDAPVDTRYMLIVVKGNNDFSCAAEVGIVQLTSETIREAAIAELECYANLLPGADELVENAIETVKEAPAASIAEKAPAAIEKLKKDLNTLLESLIDDGSYLTITNVRRGQYLASKAVEATETAEAFMSANTTVAADTDAVWTLVRKSTSTETEAADETTDEVDNTFVLRNEKLGESGYLCYLPDTSSSNMCMGDYESAYHFTAEFTTNGIAFLMGNDLGLNINSTDGYLTWYDYTDAGSMWQIGTLPTYEGDSEAAITWPGAPYLEFEDGDEVWGVYYTIDAITSFNVTLPEGFKPSGLGTGFVYYYYYNASDEIVDAYAVEGITASDLVYNEENGTWTYTLPAPCTKSAYYYAAFDANFFYATAEDGTVSYLPVVESDWLLSSYSPETELPLVVTPAEGDVTELSEVCLSMEDPYIDLNFSKSETISLSKDGEVVATYASVDLVPAADYSYYFWTLPQTYTEAGTYTLTVPAQVLVGVYGRSAATTVTWTIAEPQSGITDVTVEGKAAKVYDLQGRRVVRPVRGSVNIVDGKKTIVRK